MDVIRIHLNSLRDYDRTNYESVLNGITTMVVDQWGSTVPVQILLVTDGSPGFGPGSLKETVEKAKPFPFPAKMNILSMSTYPLRLSSLSRVTGSQCVYSCL